MKVWELEGARLDHWVAKAEGKKLEVANGGLLHIEVWHGEYEVYSPSSNWSQGGPIIEREGIKLKGGMFEKWSATLKAPNYKYGMEGPTALIAAMRAFVASRFGVEVDDS